MEQTEHKRTGIVIGEFAALGKSLRDNILILVIDLWHPIRKWSSFRLCSFVGRAAHFAGVISRKTRVRRTCIGRPTVGSRQMLLLVERWVQPSVSRSLRFSKRSRREAQIEPIRYALPRGLFGSGCFFTSGVPKYAGRSFPALATLRSRHTAPPPAASLNCPYARSAPDPQAGGSPRLRRPLADPQ